MRWRKRRRARSARGARQRPDGLDAPAGVERIPVRSTEQMHRAVLAKLSDATVVVMAAAVADYRPCRAAQKDQARLGAA